MKLLVKKIMTKKNFIMLGLGLIVLTGTFLFLSGKDEISIASTPGVVDVSGGVSVRKDPNLSEEILQYGNRDVRLENGSRVFVLKTVKEWYQISFVYQKTTLKGYVKAKYISVNKVSGDADVPAKVKTSSVPVRKAAGEKGDILLEAGEKVLLGKNKKVIIQKEEVEQEEKWYYISFTYNRKALTGYVNSKYIRLELEEGLPSVIRSVDDVPVRTDAGLKNPLLQVDSNPVYLYDTKNVTLLKEKVHAGQKWFKISFLFNGEECRGYVPAMKVRFGMMQENMPAPTATPAPTMTAAPTPIPTAVPSPIVQPKQDEKAAIPTPMSEKAFKKHLKAQNFPEDYRKALEALHKQYPYWQFEAMHTNLDWKTVLQNESAQGLNLITNGKALSWKSLAAGSYDWGTDSFKAYDGTSWVAASTTAVAYYMDPRNFLNGTDIFQFEKLTYQKDSQTREGVEEILYNTPYYKKTFSYKDENDKDVSMYYSEAFIKAAEASGVSPYHLASRMKQEVVTGPNSLSVAVTGTASGYTGIYNFYNIGATHSASPVYNGLRFATSGSGYLRPWNDPYKAIVGGGIFIGDTYVNRGQNTSYLQKFNVTPDRTYLHQYMANIEAPSSEAGKTAIAYGKSKANMVIVFSIPVYKNMPKQACKAPAGDANPNNYLAMLKVQGYEMEPAFALRDDGSTTYKVTVPKSTESVIIQAKAVSSKAKVRGDGRKALKKGKNIIKIEVTAQNGSVRSYKICITRRQTDVTGSENGKSEPTANPTAKPTAKPQATAKPEPTKKPSATAKPEPTTEPEEGATDENQGE